METKSLIKLKKEEIKKRMVGSQCIEMFSASSQPYNVRKLHTNLEEL